MSRKKANRNPPDTYIQCLGCQSGSTPLEKRCQSLFTL